MSAKRQPWHAVATNLVDVAMGRQHADLVIHQWLPILGALVADGWLGKYRVILALSVVYCVGHAVLAVNTTRTGLVLGLGILAIGAGGIKPCVSAHVGDQFGQQNAHLVTRAFAFFYLSINLGAAVAMNLTPVLLARWGPHAAFGLPGVLMVVATLVFWLGRKRFAHIPPGGRAFLTHEDAFAGLDGAAP